VRRPAPRHLASALEQAIGEAAPPGLLGRVQSVWGAVAGPVVAGESLPVSERDGVVTVACRSAVWAQELELLGGDLRGRLNDRLGSAAEGPPVSRLRFVVRDP
jgi:predicted nucleic acid-binding Zn ribbon protein